MALRDSSLHRSLSDPYHETSWSTTRRVAIDEDSEHDVVSDRFQPFQNSKRLPCTALGITGSPYDHDSDDGHRAPSTCITTLSAIQTFTARVVNTTRGNIKKKEERHSVRAHREQWPASQNPVVSVRTKFCLPDALHHQSSYRHKWIGTPTNTFG